MISEIQLMGEMFGEIMGSGKNPELVKTLPNREKLSTCLVFSEDEKGVQLKFVRPEDAGIMDWGTTEYASFTKSTQYPLVNIKNKNKSTIKHPADMTLPVLVEWFKTQTVFLKNYNNLVELTHEFAGKIADRGKFPSIAEKLEKLDKRMSEVSTDVVLERFCSWIQENVESVESLSKFRVHLLVDNEDFSENMLCENNNMMLALSDMIVDKDLGSFGDVQFGKQRVKVYSRNADAQIYSRYGLNSLAAIPFIDARKKKEIFDTLGFLAQPEHENKVWKLIRRDDECPLLFLFAANHVVSGVEELDVEEVLGDTLSVDFEVAKPTKTKLTTKELRTSEIEEQTGAVVTALNLPKFRLSDKLEKVRSIVKPDVPVMVLVINVEDKIASSIAYSSELTAEQIVQSCTEWIDSCKKASCNWDINIMQIVRCLNRRWTRNSLGKKYSQKDPSVFKLLSVIEVFDWIHKQSTEVTQKIVSILSENHSNVLIDIQATSGASQFSNKPLIDQKDRAYTDRFAIGSVIQHISKQVNIPEWDGYKLGKAIYQFEKLQIAYHKGCSSDGFKPHGKELVHLSVESPWRGLKQVLSRSQVYVAWALKQKDPYVRDLVGYFRNSIDKLEGLEFKNGDLKLGLAVGYSNMIF